MNMKKEDGIATLNVLLILAVTIIIVGVIIAMIYEKPQKTTKIQNTTSTQNSIIDKDKNLNEQDSEKAVNIQKTEW